MPHPAEDRLRRIARLAQRTLRMPLAQIELLEPRLLIREIGDRLEFSRLPPFDPPLDEPLTIISDLRLDPRFVHLRGATDAPVLQFYAGRVLALDGGRIGSLCVLDTRLRSLGHEECDILNDLAELTEDILRYNQLVSAQADLQNTLEEVRRQALIDPLTRCWNRQGIQEMLQREIAYAQRMNERFSLFMLDIDHFKSINDRHGHLVGDAVLGEVISRVRQSLRAYDTIGRYGGDEFLLIVPGSDQRQVEAIGAKIRARITDQPVETPSVTLPVTLSLGATVFQPTDNMTRLIERADRALYRAKSDGRDRLVIG